jgi:Eukaryotic aspartyl protease
MLVGGSDPQPEKVTSVASVAIRNIRNIVYLTSIGVGGAEYTAVLDTGSADTWLAGEGFNCVAMSGAAVASSSCKFAKPYHYSSTWVEDKDQRFSTKYADGETLQGVIGRDIVSLGGISVSNQTLGIVKTATWKGDGVSSGLVGMAFPSVTRSMGQKVGSAASPYDPVVFSMYKAGLIKPVFSVALNRLDEGHGSLTLGGLPPANIKHTNKWVVVPIEYLTIKAIAGTPVSASAKKEYSLYAVKATSFRINDKVINGGAGLVVDSGTTMSYLPEDIVSAMAEAWSPPGVRDPLTRLYLVRCNSKAPKFEIVFGETALRIDAKDLVLSNGSGATAICSMAIQPSKGLSGSGGVSVLGGPFMKSVVVVHDLGAGEMRFANRIR